MATADAPPPPDADPVRRCQSELDLIYRHVPVMMFLVDDCCRVARASHSAVEVSGQTVESMVGLTLGQALCCVNAGTDSSCCGRQPICEGCALHQTLVTTKATGANQFRVKASTTVDRGHGPRLVSGLLSTFVLDTGRDRQILVYFEDITDHRRAKRKLKAREATLQSLFKAAPTGIGMVRHRVIAEANDRLCAMTGYGREELIGQSARILYPSDDDFNYVGKEKYRQISDRGTGTVETRWLRKDGRIIDVLLSSTPLDAGDLSVGVTFTALDITDGKRAEKERLGLEEQLRQAQKMEAVGRLAGGVAHDLNNMLSPILGYGELLLLDLSQWDRRRGEVEQIVNSAIRARDLVRQLLAFGRKQTLEVKVVDLNAVVTGAEKLLRRTLREDVRIVMDLTADLPAIAADPVQLDQVIFNLAINAQDAMPEGGVLNLATGKVVLGDSGSAGQADPVPGVYGILAVGDTGMGMDDTVKAHLFEPFFTTKEKGKGTGLGLSTVYGIVKQHGGHLHLASQPGQGTTITIWFPAAAGTPAAAPVAAAPAVMQADATILVVEDDTEVRQVTSAMLEKLGYRVFSAHDAAQSMKIVQDHAVDLLLTDVIMPDMDGKQLYGRIASRHPGVKVLYMSGYTGDVIAERGVLQEGVHFVQKPFTQQILGQKIRDALQG